MNYQEILEQAGDVLVLTVKPVMSVMEERAGTRFRGWVQAVYAKCQDEKQT